MVLDLEHSSKSAEQLCCSGIPLESRQSKLCFDLTNNVKSLEMSLISDISAEQRSCPKQSFDERSSSAEVEPLVLLPMDNGVVRRTWNYVPSPMIDGIPKESLRLFYNVTSNDLNHLMILII